MLTLLQDLRYGLRMLRKTPGITLIVAVTLALGIAANTLIFSLVNGYILRPLRVPHPDQIVVLAMQQNGGNQFLRDFSYPDFVDFRKQAEPLADLFGYIMGFAGLSADKQPDQFFVSYVTGNFFSAFGVNAGLGRLIRPEEEDDPGPEPALVLGYSYWQKRFGGDRGVLGKRVLVNGQPVRIVGVVPKEFHGAYYFLEMDGYLPLSRTGLVDRRYGNVMTDRNARQIRVTGRLKPNVTVAQLQSSADVIAGRLAKEYPATDKDTSVAVYPEQRARPQPGIGGIVTVVAVLFLVLAGLVLLLACMNVANVLLARATVRQREMGLRAALGAGRGRLVRQTLTETVLLGFLGALFGVIAGAWLNPGDFGKIAGMPFPVNLDFGFDWRVFAYALAATLFTGIFIGVWPALRASRADVNVLLHEGGRNGTGTVGRHRARNVLVVAQVGGSLMLLIVAGLFVRSLDGVGKISLGFDPDRVLNVVVDPYQIGYDETRAKAFYRQLEDRVRAVPGVQSASLAFGVPMGMAAGVNLGSVTIEGQPLGPGQQPPSIFYNNADPRYLETMRVPLVRGRWFTDFDNETAPRVVVVNQAMANRFWPNQDPIGKRFTLKAVVGPSSPAMEVVGVTATGKYAFIAESPSPFFYVPLAQNFTTMRTLQVRSLVPPETLAGPIRQEIRRLAPDLPVIEVQAMKVALDGPNGLQVFRYGAWAAAGIGIVGLILAVVGVYGVVSFAAVQRTREIGVRMALGGSPRDVLGLILKQGSRLVIVGLLFGLLAAWGVTRVMAGLLIGVSPSDPLTYVMVAAVLSGVALLACYIPARRAMRVDPMVALRHE